jgi:hypothetical protein
VATFIIRILTVDNKASGANASKFSITAGTGILTYKTIQLSVHDNDEVAGTVAIVATDIAGNEAERLIAVSVKVNLVRGFVINGENANDKSGHSKIFLLLIHYLDRLPKRQQSNHLNHRR